MKIARIVRAAAIAAAGALAAAGAAQAAPALNFAADPAPTAKSEATPVHHYGSYHNGYYNQGYYQQPYYGPYSYAPPPPPPRYYAPYSYGPRYGYDGYHGYRHRPHGGLFIRTPGLRLGIGF